MNRGYGLFALASLVVACQPTKAPRASAPEPSTIAGLAPVPTSSAAVAYRLSVPAPATHYAHIQAVFPARGRETITVMMPVWTPGSYLVREYARHIDRLSAEDPAGRPLPMEKVRKNRWRVQLKGADRAILRYRVYANEPSVRTNSIDEDFFVLAGAATFLADTEALAAPHELTLDIGKVYADVAADMPVDGAGVRRARNYDHLVDAPIVAGDLRRLPFKVEGVPHELIHLGAAEHWPDKRTQTDVARLTEEIVSFWGEIPYERYLFFNVINETRGGLEHKGSTLMMSKRFQTRTEAGYRSWLGLVSHEFFHTWNGKRLRPHALGPFDYENEVYTESLWFVEGLTSYYDDLLMHRAGLMNQKQYFKALSKQIGRLEGTPGRLEQPLSRASYDAWIEYYRHDESSKNTTVSYYTKGSVVGFVLDMEIRKATGGTKSLDDVMKAAYRGYSMERGYSRTELLDVFEQVAGKKIRQRVEVLTTTTEPIDYKRALHWAGLRFKSPAAPDKEATAIERAETLRKKTWLGVETEDRSGRLVIKRVVSGSPAEQGGLQFGDEIVALDGVRINADLPKRLKLYSAQDKVSVLIARRKSMQTRTVVLGTAPKSQFELQIDPDASALADKHRRDWL